jgi:hypothetical protein
VIGWMRKGPNLYARDSRAAVLRINAAHMARPREPASLPLGAIYFVCRTQKRCRPTILPRCAEYVTNWVAPGGTDEDYSGHAVTSRKLAIGGMHFYGAPNNHAPLKSCGAPRHVPLNNVIYVAHQLFMRHRIWHLSTNSSCATEI